MNTSNNLKRVDYVWILGAILVGFLVRVPGVFWGSNFPSGWQINHIDEYTHWILAEHLIDPSTPVRWSNPYPNGMAAHVAVPMILWRALSGQLFESAPDIISIVVTGRILSVLYGTATILLVFLISRLLLKDKRPGIIAAWMMALGGLHISQSHFFLADVPALFWFLLGIYLLLLEFNQPDKNYSPFLMGAAFSFGIALGLKLFYIGLPTLVIVALWRSPRILRLIYTGIFYFAAFGMVTLLAYGYYDLFKTVTGVGVAGKCDCSAWQSLLLYFIELPSLMSLPVFILAAIGGILLGYKLLKFRDHSLFWQVNIVIILPLVLYTISVLFTLDHFLRHLIPYIPWMAIAAAWLLVKIGDSLKKKKIHPGLVYTSLFLYLLLFAFDGERLYITEPRNRAADWIFTNVTAGSTYNWRAHQKLPDYIHIPNPIEERPDIVVIEMHHANQILSGYGLKNSLPRDYRKIFGSDSQENVDWIQSLFNGSSEYRKTASFQEGYFMPEFVLVEQLLGNRSRNYLAEVIIFQRDKE